MSHVSIAIDSEFQSLIPPLTDDEYQRLEKSILAEGVREPIVTWNGTIIDGHNRYHICEEHGIEFKTVEREFASRDAAKIWIIENQFGRRNLTSGQKAALAIEQDEAKAREAARLRQVQAARANGGDRKSAEYRENRVGIERARRDSDPEQTQSVQEQTGRVAEILARKAGVGEATIKRALKVKRERPELYEKVKSGEVPVTTAYNETTERSQVKYATDDKRRICSICGEPIDDGDAYPYHPTVHKKCHNAKKRTYNGQYDNPDKSLLENVPIYTIETLLGELTASAENMREAMEESIAINESMGVHLTNAQRKKLDRAILHVLKTIQKIGEEADNG